MTTQITADNIVAGEVVTPAQLSANISSVTTSLAVPKISSISVANSTYHVQDDTAVNTGGGYIVITGSNFSPNATVIIGETQATSVSVVDTQTIRAQIPAKTAATYSVYVSNDDGATAIKVNGLSYSASPTWVTNSTLTTVIVGEAFNISLSATGATSYSLVSGSLPSGVTLSSGGSLSGTITGITVSTNYNFTIRATDAENQDSDKTFTLPAQAIIRGQCLYEGLVRYTTGSACFCSYSLTIPNGVTSVSLVAIGGGGAGYNLAASNSGICAGNGAGLAWVSWLPVVAGETLSIIAAGSGNCYGSGLQNGWCSCVSYAGTYCWSVVAGGGTGGYSGTGGCPGGNSFTFCGVSHSACYGTYSTTVWGCTVEFGGGKGGCGGTPVGYTYQGRGGGGGAGGYYGCGGHGGYYNWSPSTGQAGSGGAGGGGWGGNASFQFYGTGGGTSVFGYDGNNSAAGGTCTAANGCTGSGTICSTGYGGGGGASYDNGQAGAVRIVWGPGRAYPCTCVSTNL